MERKAAFLDFSVMTKVYGSYLLRYSVLDDLERHVRAFKSAPTSTLHRINIKIITDCGKTFELRS